MRYIGTLCNASNADFPKTRSTRNSLIATLLLLNAPPTAAFPRACSTLAILPPPPASPPTRLYVFRFVPSARATPTNRLSAATGAQCRFTSCSTTSRSSFPTMPSIPFLVSDDNNKKSEAAEHSRAGRLRSVWIYSRCSAQHCCTPELLSSSGGLASTRASTAMPTLVLTSRSADCYGEYHAPLDRF